MNTRTQLAKRALRLAKNCLVGSDEVVRLPGANYKLITKIRRIPVASDKCGNVIVGNDELERLGMKIGGKGYLSDRQTDKMFSGEVVIEEKVDGHPEVISYGGYTWFGENLKYVHSVQYDKIPVSGGVFPDSVVIYDIMDGPMSSKKWLSRDEKESLCRMERVPWFTCCIRVG